MRPVEKVLGVPLSLVGGSNKEYAPDDFLRILNTPPHGAHYFTKPVDFIVLGSCSHAFGPDPLEAVGEFWELLAKRRTGTLLLLSRCCGPYSERFTAEIERRSPGITLLAPKTADYCNFPTSREVVRDLLAAGIIRKAAT